MATKAAHTAFNRSVSAYLQSIGAELRQHKFFYDNWNLKTIAGDLSISITEPERSEVFSLYCQFEHPYKASEAINGAESDRLNVLTGKWNFHSYDAKELLEEFKQEVAPLLWESIDINDPDFDPTIRPKEEDYTYGARDASGEIYDQIDKSYYDDLKKWELLNKVTPKK